MSVREGNVVDMLETLRTRAASCAAAITPPAAEPVRERDPFAFVDELYENAKKLAEAIPILLNERNWFEQQWKAARRRERALAREVEVEHRLRFPVEDTDVLAALRAIGGAPVRARAVASAMFQDSTLWHGDVIRVGFALSRLADAGLVRRLASRCSGSGAVWEAVTDTEAPPATRTHALPPRSYAGLTDDGREAAVAKLIEAGFGR